MWAEAMAKLEGMESADRERLWPQLVQGFKDLSQRLKVFQFTAKCVSASRFCVIHIFAYLIMLHDFFAHLLS